MVYSTAMDIAVYGEKWRGQTNTMSGDCMKLQNDGVSDENET
jgi:hypothetical protein